jgi:hypothetical protein
MKTSEKADLLADLLLGGEFLFLLLALHQGSELKYLHGDFEFLEKNASSDKHP